MLNRYETDISAKKEIDWMKVNQELSTFLKDYTSKLPEQAKSARSIELRSELKKTTLAELLNGEITSESRKRKTIEGILDLTKGQKSTSEHIENLAGTETSFALKESLKTSPFSKDVITLTPTQAAPYVGSSSWRIMTLASFEGGVPESVLRARFGEEEVRNAETLVSEKHLTKQDGCYASSYNAKTKNLPPSVLKEQAELLINRCLDLSKVGMKDNNNHLLSTVKKVNKDFFKEMDVIFENFTKAVRDAADKNKGEEVVFIAAACDTIIRENLTIREN